MYDGQAEVICTEHELAMQMIGGEPGLPCQSHCTMSFEVRFTCVLYLLFKWKLSTATRMDFRMRLDTTCGGTAVCIISTPQVGELESCGGDSL